MPKIYWDVVQGSALWLDLRKGRVTASQAKNIITPSGAPSKSASDFANRLLCEVMLDRPLMGVITAIMQRGKDLEQSAIQYYELIKDVETRTVGFVLRNDMRVGASPDRFVADNIIVEAKCPTEETHSKYLSSHIDALLGSQSPGTYEAYKVQCQTLLYICEREYCDVISFYPGLPESLMRIGRDEKFIKALERELATFLAMFDERLEKLKALGYLDGLVESKRKQPPKSEAEEMTGLGVTEADVTAYIEALKQKGAL